MTPNSRKLYNIGRELDKLGRIINDMTPVSELPFNVRPTSRKEKNKLASRACRLKKKAQHEANKIKLSGLELEHSKNAKIDTLIDNINDLSFSERLINGIINAKRILTTKLAEQSQEKQEELTATLEKNVKNATSKYETISISIASLEKSQTSKFNSPHLSNAKHIPIVVIKKYLFICFEV